MTEDKLHHDKLFKVPKRLNKHNRYTDIHPCTIKIYLIDSYNICCLSNNDITNNLDLNYFNASYIQVSKLNFVYSFLF